MSLDLSMLLIDAVNDDVQNISVASRARLANYLFNWLSVTARKRAVPDLVSRIERMRKRFDHLAHSLTLEVDRGNLIVRATGDAETTLRQLEFGTTWFAAHVDIHATIVNLLLAEQAT